MVNCSPPKKKKKGLGSEEPAVLSTVRAADFDIVLNDS